jgi:membrane-bound ClpP family serine protease
MDFFQLMPTISWLHLLIFITGIALIIVEMLHPGVTAPGITGGVLLIVGIALTAKSALQAAIMLFLLVIILGIAFAIVLKSATSGKLSKTLILNEAQKKETGYIGTTNLESLIGKQGTVIGILRPSGTADFNGEKIDVVSEGEFIKKGTLVEVIKVEGPRILVRSVNTNI